jgi:hypothetical protein
MKLRIVDGNDAGIEHEGRGRRAALAGVVMALGVSGLAVPQAQALPVCATSGNSACCKITSPGIYQLHANVNVKIASGDCISVQAANVVLIANDHNLATDVDCESNGNNGARASYSFLDASSSSGNGFVNDGAAGLKMTSVAADGNGGNGLLLINTSGALFADFSEADGNGNNGIKVIGGGSNTMVTIDASTNSADGIWFKHSVANTVIDFTANGNGKTGIYIGCSATGNPDGSSCGVSPSRGNSLQAGVGFQAVPATTTADTNTFAGIGIDSGNGGNQVFGIEASGNGTDDAIDKNANCGSNFWSMNSFAKASPACTNAQ